jgi:hypothetical protein
VAACGLPLTLEHLVQPRKVYSLAPAYSSIPPRHNQYDHGQLSCEVAVGDTLITNDSEGGEVGRIGEVGVVLSSKGTGRDEDVMQVSGERRRLVFFTLPL